MRRIVLAAVVVLVTAYGFAQGMPVVQIPRIDVMPEYPGAPSIAQISPDRAVVAWCAAEEQRIAIYASVVIPSLGISDDHPMRLAEASGTTMVEPLVAKAGDGFVVVWREPDGAHAVVVAGPSSTFSPGQAIVPNAAPLAIAASESETLLVFATESYMPLHQWMLGVAFLTENAGIRKIEWIDVLANQPHAAVTPSGDGFLLAYSEQRSEAPMLVRRVTIEAVSGSVQIGDAGWSDALSISASPNSALAIWSKQGGGSPFVARHLQLDGRPVGEQFSVVDWGDRPDVAWDGSKFIVTYMREAAVRVGYVAEGGTSLENDNEVAVGGLSRVVSVGSLSTLAFIRPADDGYAASHGTVEAASIDGSGRALSTMTVSRSFARQDVPAAAAAGDVTLVAWVEQTGRDSRSVFAARVDRDGRSLDPDGISLHDGSIQGAPAIASTGSEFLVVWPEYDRSSNTSRIVGQRISASGASPGIGGPFEIAAMPDLTTEVAIAWNGEHYLVAWPMSYSANPSRGIEVALVLPTGVVTTRNVVRFPDGGGTVSALTVAAGDGFLITADLSTGASIAVENALITALDRSAEVITPPALIDLYGFHPSVAALGDRFLVVWTRADEVKSTFARYYDRAANAVSDVISLYPSSAARLSSVISDGTGFVVAFAPGELSSMPLLATIRGDSVTGISIAAEPSLRIDPSTTLVMTASGLLSVFRAFDANWTNTARVYTRRVPGTGAVDVSAALVAPGEAQRGSVIRVPLRVANVGTQPATGIEAHVDVYGGRVVSYPYGCSAGPFAISVLCPEPELQPGSAAYLYFEVEVLHPNLLLKAAAYAHEQDPATQNNLATANVNVTPVTRTRAVRR